MKRPRPTFRRPERRFFRDATSSLEVMMAFTLLSTVLACSTPLVVRHQRLISDQRDYRLALDEAANQIERLSVLSRGELREAIGRLQPSDFVVGRLADVTVRGELKTLTIGERVKISVSWGNEQRAAAPVTLAAWFPSQESLATESARGESP